jgi:hypothetical protein
MGLALLGCAVIAAPVAGQQQGKTTTPDPVALAGRMQAFLRAIEGERPKALTRFFPRAGDLTWVHTLHKDEGTRVTIRRFPSLELARALKYDGPLWPSFEIQFEGQPIGLFHHQAMLRQAFALRGWRLVRGTRFVPAGEPETAGLFVEWRRESGRWVVSAFGDEGYRVRDAGKLPRWCC